MRSGLYAVVDGVEYPAWLNSEGLGIYLDHAGPRPDGWAWFTESRSYRRVSPAQVTEAYRVSTSAMLDDVLVAVDSVDALAHTALVRAVRPRYSSINDQDKPPPHPLLEATPVSSYSVDWIGVIPWERLTMATEIVGKVDPTAGEVNYYNFT